MFHPPSPFTGKANFPYRFVSFFRIVCCAVFTSLKGHLTTYRKKTRHQSRFMLPAFLLICLFFLFFFVFFLSWEFRPARMTLPLSYVALLLIFLKYFSFLIQYSIQLGQNSNDAGANLPRLEQLDGHQSPRDGQSHPLPHFLVYTDIHEYIVQDVNVGYKFYLFGK